MPLSDDPEKRARQLRNLPNLRGELPAGAWPPGTTNHLVHGARTRRPARAYLDPVVAEVVEEFEAIVPLRGADGGPMPALIPMIESAAEARLIRRRIRGYLDTHGDVDVATGELRPAVDAYGRALEREQRSLDRLALTVTSMVKSGLDLARASSFSLAAHWAEEDERARADAEGTTVEDEGG